MTKLISSHKTCQGPDKKIPTEIKEALRMVHSLAGNAADKEQFEVYLRDMCADLAQTIMENQNGKDDV